MNAEVENTLDEIVRKSRIIVCVGSGGVGKTTTSAVIALHGAQTGRKVLVLTIDPAKRLANSLGVDELDNDEKRIRLDELGGEPCKGELWAMMLDMKHSFDRLVERYAADEAARQRIFDNKFYQYFSTSLAGTQEYSAMERLHSLYEDQKYDLIVLDTPPTNHALDFLDAPLRMAEAVETSALQWMYKPSLAAGKFSVGLFSIGTTYVLKTISKFTGGELLTELREFLVAFSDMLEGFGTRARRVREVLKSDATTFLIVTSPDPSTVDEARYFRGQLDEQELPFGGFIVNRVHRGYAERELLEREPADIAAQIAERAGVEVDPALEGFAAELLENAKEFQVLADLDAQTLEGLHERTGGKFLICQVPFFSRDIHSFAGLDRVREALFERCCDEP